MTNKKEIVQQLVRKGEATYNTIPKLSCLPRGREALTASFVVNEMAMAEMAQQVGLNADIVLKMIGGEEWDGISLKPIEAALIAPAFDAEQQKRIAAVLEQAQREFWEAQHFYLDEMAGPQAGAIPNVFMRDTLLAIEERVTAHLRQKLSDGASQPIIWIDYAAGPASFVNGALQRLKCEGFDLGRMQVVLVEPAKPFREYACRQPVLSELLKDGRLFLVEGILEDRETYEKVGAFLQSDCKADVVTQAFGASYVADHLRPAMWKEMFGTAHAEGLKMVVAPTIKFNPSSMITDLLKDKIKKKKAASANGGAGLASVPIFFQAFGDWTGAFMRPVPVDCAGNTKPALVALIKYGQGVKDYCPIHQTGEAFESEIEKATSLKVKSVTPVLDEQAVLIEL